MSVDLSLLDRRLLHFHRSEDLLHLAERIFQKKPELATKLNNEIQKAKGNTERKYVARRFLRRTIKTAINDPENEEVRGIPKKLDNYVSFLDLVKVVQNANDERRAIWHTFTLHNYDYSSNESLPLQKIRRRLKQFLPETHLASVQIEVDGDEEQNENIRIFIRVAMIKKSKRGVNDENNLMKRVPTFFAVYPNEPYFYSESKDPDPAICMALCQCLFSENYAPLQLSGPHLASLRQMRQNKDGKRQQFLEKPKPASTSEKQLLQLWPDEMHYSKEEQEKEDRLPIVNKLVIAGKDSFRDLTMLQQLHNGLIPCRVTELEFKMTFKSPDVLNTFRSSEASKMLEDGNTPDWLRNIPNAGTNVITDIGLAE